MNLLDGLILATGATAAVGGYRLGLVARALSWTGMAVGIGVAARQLGVSRPTVYRWMDEGSLDYVRDTLTGRLFVLRRGVDQRRRGAEELVISR